jgi:hypothetical protein
MSKIAVNELTDELGTGAPAFPNGMSVTGAALTDPEITGGIYLGGTGSANYLDDYEEGTWTPATEGHNGTIASTVSGRYVKIGNFVVATGVITRDSGSVTSLLKVTNLPFQVNDFASAAIDSAGGVDVDSGRLQKFSSSIECKLNGLSITSGSGSLNLVFSVSYYT